MRTAVAERVDGQRRMKAVIGIDKNIARLLVRDLVIAELERRHAAPDAHIEAAVAQVIEDADLLGQPQRRIQRQQIDERPEPHAPGRARNRGKIEARHRHKIERGGMVLGDVQAIDAGLVGGGREGEPLVERGRDRPVRAFDMIEKSDQH
jgi:acetaldehyde dehydrogenase (acetylating)